ncbi:MAG: hypothetical protein FWE28_02730 [Oscillospiraceae bacterium]|nr:hypothetical protein [Oscillospiraceae bacterium]
MSENHAGTYVGKIIKDPRYQAGSLSGAYYFKIEDGTIIDDESMICLKRAKDSKQKKILDGLIGKSVSLMIMENALKKPDVYMPSKIQCTYWLDHPEWFGKNLLKNLEQEPDAVPDTSASNPKEKNHQNQNIILYGAPGTGKTYNSVHRALSIIDEESLEELNSDQDVFELYRTLNVKVKFLNLENPDFDFVNQLFKTEG